MTSPPRLTATSSAPTDAGVDLEVGRQIGPRAVGEHVRMLEQQQMLLAAVGEQRLLQRERLAVGHPAEPADAQRSAGRIGRMASCASAQSSLRPVAGLEDLLHLHQEAGGVGAVEGAVVPAIARLPTGWMTIASSPLGSRDHDRLADDRVGARGSRPAAG